MSQFRLDNVSGITTTRYIGNVEIIFKPNGDQDRKRYIAGVAIETIHFGNNNIEDSRETHYLHKDHLGSLDVITDATGAIVQELSFDAWGQRRNAIDWTALTSTELITFDHSLTTRGFTGHEMLDEVATIHMNGRIYDARLGRFLQADPFIQDPLNTQSLNRYSYVWNNPLNATDPSGYAVFSLFTALALGKAVVDGVIAIEAFMAAMAIAGFTDAMAAGASFQDALLAGLASAALSGAGVHFLPQGGFASVHEFVSYSAKIGVVGGITNVLQGGKFGHGFRSAAINNLVGGIAGGIANELKLGKIGQSIARVVAGGTISEITGGKFVNGAATAAFSAAVTLGTNSTQMTRDETSEFEEGDATRFTDEQKQEIRLKIALAVDDPVGEGLFETEEAVAKYLRSKLQPIAEHYNIEIGAHIFKVRGQELFTFDSPVTSFNSLGLLLTDFPPIEYQAPFHTHQTRASFSGVFFGDLGFAEKSRANSYLSNRAGLFVYESPQFRLAWREYEYNGAPMPRRIDFVKRIQ